jgi:hypothetical protein
MNQEMVFEHWFHMYHMARLWAKWGSYSPVRSRCPCYIHISFACAGVAVCVCGATHSTTLHHTPSQRGVVEREDCSLVDPFVPCWYVSRESLRLIRTRQGGTGPISYYVLCTRMLTTISVCIQQSKRQKGPDACGWLVATLCILSM